MPDVVSNLRDAGFNDQEIQDWATDKRNKLLSAGFSDGEVDDYFGAPKTPKGAPPALVDRILKAVDFSSRITSLPAAVTDIPHEAMKTTIDDFKSIVSNLLPKEFGGSREPAKEGEAEGMAKTGAGLFDIAALPFAPIQGALRALVGHPMVAVDEALRSGAVQLYGEEKVAKAEREVGQPEGPMTFEQAKKRIDMAMMAIGSRPLMRIGMGPMEAPEVTPIGGLPRSQDFTNASTALGNGDPLPHVEDKLATLYQEKGIHPAEVAHDAQTDPTIAPSMLSSDKADLPAAYGLSTNKGSMPSYIENVITKEEQIPSVDEMKNPGMCYSYSAKMAMRHDDLNYVIGSVSEGHQNPIYHAWAETTDGKFVYDGTYDRWMDANLYYEATGAKAFYRDQITPTEKIDIRNGTNPGPNYMGLKGGPEDQATLPRLDTTEDILSERQPSSAGASAAQQPTYSDAEKQILSKISVDEKAPEAKLTWDKLYTNFLDKMFPIAKAVKESGAELTAEDNPYNLARLLNGHVGKADHFLNRGTFDFSTYENNGPSLKSILNPVRGDLNGFRAYATAARALELEDRGIKSGFAEAESAPPLVSSGLDAARTVVVEGRDKFEQPFRALVDYQNRVSQYLRDAGVLSDAGYSAMLEANKMYVPFSRVMGLDEGAAARGGSSLQARNPIKAIKGSARDIVDPIENVVRNTYHFIEMAERNQVGTKLVDMLANASKELPEAPAAVATEAVGANPRAGAMADALGEIGIKKPDELASALAHAAEPTRAGEIAVLRDGKRETYKVDPDLARAMKGLDAQSMGLLEKVLAYPASVLRAGAVTTPDFALRHTIRDFLYAATTFKGGTFTPIDMAKGFTGLIMKDGDYWNWLKGGGGNISMVGMDRQYLQADIRKLTGQTGLAGRAWNVLADPEASMFDKAGALGKLPFQAIDKFLLDPLRAATQFAESASHLGAFKKTLRASERAEPEADNLRGQIIQAAWASRDTAVDAARMGANMRAYNMITAFANIKLQDTDRVVRAIKDNPIATLTKIGAAITAPSVALWAANHDDPRYAEIPQWQKDMFWLVMTPDHVFRIPKPWAMGMIFGSGPERLLDAYYAEKPEAFKEYFKSLWAASGPDFVPTAASPIIDQFANRSTFTNRTLIPSEQEKFLPEYQYTPYTTELTKSLGKIIGAFPGMTELKMENSGWGGTARALTSPILMENYIRGWSGTLGVYALNAADAALRKTGMLPDPPQPASTLADIPVIKAFVVRYPSASAESVQSFYDAYATNKAYFDTWMAKAREGDAEAMAHIQQMGGPMMFAQLDQVKSVLSEHSQLVRDLYKNPEIPPDEKRQLIDQLYFSMIQVARNGNDALRDLRRQSDAIAAAARGIGPDLTAQPQQ